MYGHMMGPPRMMGPGVGNPPSMYGMGQMNFPMMGKMGPSSMAPTSYGYSPQSMYSQPPIQSGGGMMMQGLHSVSMMGGNIGQMMPGGQPQNIIPGSMGQMMPGPQPPGAMNSNMGQMMGGPQPQNPIGANMGQMMPGGMAPRGPMENHLMASGNPNVIPMGPQFMGPPQGGINNQFSNPMMMGMSQQPQMSIGGQGMPMGPQQQASGGNIGGVMPSMGPGGMPVNTMGMNQMAYPGGFAPQMGKPQPSVGYPSSANEQTIYSSETTYLYADNASGQQMGKSDANSFRQSPQTISANAQAPVHITSQIIPWSKPLDSSSQSQSMMSQPGNVSQQLSSVTTPSNSSAGSGLTMMQPTLQAWPNTGGNVTLPGSKKATSSGGSGIY